MTSTSRAASSRCPSCGTPLDCGDAVLNSNDVTVERCRGCGVKFARDWQSTLERYDEVYSYYDRSLGVDIRERYSPLNRPRLESLLREWAPLAKGRRLLDVGCGHGQMVHTALEMGWAAEGIDLAEGAVAACQAAGLPVQRLDFFSDDVPSNSYDVVVMSEFLEHVSQPGRFLARAEEVLRPAGLVYLTTPNFASLSRRILGDKWRAIHPEHILYWEDATLRALVSARTRLKVVSLRTVNLSVGALIEHVRRHLPSASASGTTVSEPSGGSSERREATRRVDQRLRAASGRGVGALAKGGLNGLLAATRLGDSLVCTLQKR